MLGSVPELQAELFKPLRPKKPEPPKPGQPPKKPEPKPDPRVVTHLRDNIFSRMHSEKRPFRPDLNWLHRFRLYNKSQLNQMQDSHDFFLRLLNQLDDCGVAVGKIFGGKTIQRVVCKACNTCSDRKDPFLDLSLSFPVGAGGNNMMHGGMMRGRFNAFGGRSKSMGRGGPEIVDLDALLDHYFREEQLFGDNK